MSEIHHQRFLRSAITLTGSFIAAVVVAADAPDVVPTAPKSTAAVAAIQKADAAQKELQSTYDQAMFKVKRTESEDLKAALKVATQKGDLDEANAINALLKSTLEEMNKPYAPGSKSSKTEAMLGRWIVVVGGKEDKWVITSTAVKHGEETGEPAVRGNEMVIKWQNGWISRLTFQGDHFFKEAWRPGQAVDTRPDNLSEGFRDTGKEKG